MHLARELHATSLCRQKYPQRTHGGKQSWAAGLLRCPMACQSLGTSVSSLTFCHWSGRHVCPRVNSPVLLRAPSPWAQTPCWPITGVGDGRLPPWAWRWLLRKPSPPPTHYPSPVAGAMVRGWDARQEHPIAFTALAHALGLCFIAAFPWQC